MGLLSENVTPSDHERIFGTNASTDSEMEIIKNAVEKVDGVKDVVLIAEIFLREFIVHTTKIVSVKDVEDAVKHTGLHCIPKGVFPTLEK